jgi:two-component system, chemotaxis family, chemotaxis protein CheY
VIVVADDTPELLTQYRTWLESRGHIVLTATSGNDAVRIIRRQQVDVVIAEVIMANGDGLEVLQQLKVHQPAARIIAVSGGGRYLPAGDCLRVAKGLGAHEALMKPLNQADLMDTIDRLTAHIALATTASTAATSSASAASVA